MLNAIIIGNEMQEAGAIAAYLTQSKLMVCIKAKLTSVKESIEYFSENRDADLIFSDIALPDGISFDIFNKTNVHIPVVFITRFNNNPMMVFENGGIDYLPVPFANADIEKVLFKFIQFQNHFLKYKYNFQFFNAPHPLESRKKTRILVKKGIVNFALRLEDIILFYTKNKAIYALDKFSKKYLIDKTLSELDNEMDKAIFFRANRQCLININFIKSFKTFQRVKLLVDISVPDFDYPIIISQHAAPTFRKWIENT
ncbi:MAG: LytTR family transcriptional regulator DNA-binding domain-containing protein [Ferruginibacter sp.]